MKKIIECGSVGVREGVTRAVVLAAALSSLHCSSDVVGGAGAPTAIDSAEVISQTVHANETANVFVQVAPNSACNLRGTGLEDVEVHSDVRGVATFFVYLEEGDGAVELSLDCAGLAGGQPTRYPVRISTVPDDVETVAPTAWLEDLPYPGREIPPLAEDPERVTPARLFELHLPQKPDQTKSPADYAAWLERVSKPTIEVDAATVSTNRFNNLFADQNDIWAGLVTTDIISLSSEKFASAFGEWNVPAVTGPGSTGTYYSSTWVGVGGYENTNQVGFPQTGTAQKATCSRSGLRIVCTGTYYGWFEYFPDGELKATGFTVAVGNKIQAETAMVNSIGFFDPNGTSARLTLYNAKTNTLVTKTLALPSGASFHADSSEWIMERPLVNGVPTKLAKFADTTIANAGGLVADINGTTHTIYGSDSDSSTSMLEMDNFDLMVFPVHVLATTVVVTGASSPSLKVHWVASN